MDSFWRGDLVKAWSGRVVVLGLFVLLAGCTDPRDKADAALLAGDGERAVRFYAQVLDDDPTDSVARRSLGEAQLLVARARSEDGEDKPSDWSNAVRELERSSSDSSCRALLEEARFGAARALLRSGDTDRAVRKLEAVLVAQPKSTRSRNLLAIVVDRRGDPERAAELFLQNTVIDSTEVDAYFNLALVEWNLGRKLVAIDHIVKASRLAPKDPEIIWWLERMLNTGTGS